MKKLIRLEETRAVRPRLAAWAVAAVAVVAATVAGITAGQGNAAPAIKADKALHLPKKAELKQPKLKHGGLLSVQLQEPGTTAEPAALPAPSTNGKTPAEVTP